MTTKLAASKKIQKDITSRDVAKLAGVSQSTVSRAYNPAYNLSPELKARVFKAAQELGYFPNALARGLLSKRSNIVAIITSSLDNFFYASALQAFVTKLQANGFQSLVFLPEHSEDIDTVANNVLGYRVDLVLLFGAKTTTVAPEIFLDNGVPTVLFNRYVPLSQTSAVCCNDYQCGYMAADELYKGGCRRFAYISGHSDTTTNIDRQRGFVDGLKALGVTHCEIIPGGYSYESGLTAGRLLMEQAPNVDACFCINDIIAVGVLDYLKYQAKKKIPDDISVVGFDDISIAHHMGNRLSTIRQPISEMVDATIETIVELLKNPSQPPMVKIINGTFIKRDTTK